MPSVVPSGFEVPGLHESMPATREISFSDSGASFFDQLLDIVNPLQHLPGVATIYRAVTGDQISTPARLIGGALFGGPIGFASTVANMVFEEASGDDLAGHALALFDGPDEPPQLAAARGDPTAVARADAAPTARAPAALATQPGSDARRIIWNGPRVLPSLAGGAPADTAAAPADTQVQTGLAPAAAAGDARAQSPDPQPAWLQAAIADAQAVQKASQTGADARKVEARPWITEAMLEGLRKYQTLALERSQ